MKAILLVAGYATRLYPLTKDRPKPLLPIGGRPIIDYILDSLHGIKAVDRIYAVSNSKFYGHFLEWAKERNRDGNLAEIKVVDDGTDSEENRRGAIGDILYAIEEDDIDDDLTVLCGDNYFTFSLKKYYDFFVGKGTDCVCVKSIPDVSLLKRFAVAKLSESLQVLDLVEKPEKPETDVAVYGTYMYRRETLPLFEKYLRDGNPPDAPGYFVQWLHKRQPVHAYYMEGDCYDIGTPQSYEEVDRIARENNKRIRG